ncbi:hypothetical protein SAMN05216554_4638 [Herbiconiux ginsengi]|uniref:HTTM-like domain-containing protein n=1 Tax=Herbiconiux ginsengi TaxID=381665 RepID=A0A1H3U041_9MICO|nr:hypothetical protein SAMN05216554_4638 [Herbiconiux ginsengi]
MPIAVGQVLASIESLMIGGLYRKDGLLRGVSAIGVPPGSPRYRLLNALDSARTPRVLATITLVASGVLLASRGNRRLQIAASAVIGGVNRLSELRTPYGRDGADQMTGIITQYRIVSALVPDRARSDELFLRALNAQAGLSYFVSGVSKLFGSSWVQGDAIGEILQTEAYGNGPAASLLRRFPRLVRLLTWATPLWEVSFPLIYLLPSRWARAMLLGVKAFHLGIAGVMELPRFVWGFVGSHGAVQYVVDQRSQARRSAGSLERVTLASAAVIASVSAGYAASQRQFDIERRGGLKGTKLLDVDDGVVEYDLRAPSDPSVTAESAPVVVLEAGLGSPLEAFSWVAELLAVDHHVLSYHRGGYGRTTSNRSPGDLVAALLAHVVSSGTLISVSHSIGTLAAASYLRRDFGGRFISSAVVIDGTNPRLLADDRVDRRRRGMFLQSQAGSMYIALTGIYNFVPHAIARQSAFAPDDQLGVVQFSFSPRNILRATREYFNMPLVDAMQSLLAVPRRRVIASKEYEQQESEFAEALHAPIVVVEGASHRSILGYRQYAQQVAQIVRETSGDDS